MNVNLLIETKEGDGQIKIHPEVNDLISPPHSPIKKKIRKGKPRTEHKDTIITYQLYKDKILPSLNSKKKSSNFIYKQQLCKSLTALNISYNKLDKKEQLQEQLFNIFNKINAVDTPKMVKTIDNLKKSLRNKIKERKMLIYGPGYIDKSLCKNTEDFYSMETIEDTPDCYFFSTKDMHDNIWFFDIRSFKKLIDKKSDNPYTRAPFDDFTKNVFYKRVEFMKKNKLSLIYPQEKEEIKNLTPQQKIQNKLLNIFGEIDSLNVVASGTRLEWFNNLNIIQLKKFYKVLEDVWNYRAELTLIQKQEIVPNNVMFSTSVNFLFALSDKIKIQNIILNEMEKLVKSSPNENHRHTGAYYILISLTEVSYQCAQDLPWLIQY